MKIARVYPNFQIDLKYTEHYLATELSKLGHQTTFITSDKYLKFWQPYLKNKEKVGYYVYDSFDVHRLKSFTILEKTIFSDIRKLKNILFKSNFDIIHLFGIGVFTSVLVLWLSYIFKSKIPIVISDHADTRTHAREGFFANLYYLFFKIHIKIFKKKIFRYIIFSKANVKLLSNRFGANPNKFAIIPLGYDQDNYFWKPSLKNSSEKFVLGYAGKITESKRIHYLIDVLGNTEIKNKIKLIIVGYSESNPYCRRLSKQAESANFEIEFKPFATSEELSEFYNYIDLAVYPGGISITTIEASGCGVPVVIYESIEGLEERVSQGRGLLFNSEEDLRENILLYYNMYKKNMINNQEISRVTKENYSWERISKNYLKIYKQAIYENKN